MIIEKSPLRKELEMRIIMHIDSACKVLMEFRQKVEDADIEIEKLKNEIKILTREDGN